MIKGFAGWGSRLRMTLAKRLSQFQKSNKISAVAAFVVIFMCLGYMARYGVEVAKARKATRDRDFQSGDVGLRAGAIREAKRQGKDTYEFITESLPPPIMGR